MSHAPHRISSQLQYKLSLTFESKQKFHCEHVYSHATCISNTFRRSLASTPLSDKPCHVHTLHWGHGYWGTDTATLNQARTTLHDGRKRPVTARAHAPCQGDHPHYWQHHALRAHPACPQLNWGHMDAAHPDGGSASVSAHPWSTSMHAASMHASSMHAAPVASPYYDVVKLHPSTANRCNPAAH